MNEVVFTSSLASIFNTEMVNVRRSSLIDTHRHATDTSDVLSLLSLSVESSLFLHLLKDN